jgi:GntR family transcriptional regulator/MocR family aminotransferase
LPDKELLLTSLAKIAAGNWQSAMEYCGPKGDAGLREAIADTILADRGIECSNEAVLITSGTLHAVALLALMLLRKHGSVTVAVEDPGYFGFRRTLRMLGIQVLPLPVDGEGACAAPDLLAKAHAVVLTPLHQFPTNVTMSAARRERFRRLSQEQGCLLVEDDYSAGFHFLGECPPPLTAGRPRKGAVYVGSFSKVLAPGLRQGYVVAHPEIIEQLSAVRLRIDRHSPELLQLVLEQLIRSGQYRALTARTRESYHNRWRTMAKAIERHFGFKSATAGGLSFWIPTGASWDRLDAATLQAPCLGVRFNSGRECFFSPPRHASLRLGYTCVDAEFIEVGVERVARLLRDGAAGKRRGPP